MSNKECIFGSCQTNEQAISAVRDEMVKDDWVQPCQFCGNTEISIISSSYSACAMCRQCKAKGPTVIYKTDALKAWSERVIK